MPWRISRKTRKVYQVKRVGYGKAHGYRKRTYKTKSAAKRHMRRR